MYAIRFPSLTQSSGQTVYYCDAVTAGIWTLDRTVVYQLVAVVLIIAMLLSYVVWHGPLTSPKINICAWDSARKERFVLSIKITTTQTFKVNRNTLSFALRPGMSSFRHINGQVPK
jgi:hypothetical protein